MTRSPSIGSGRSDARANHAALLAAAIELFARRGPSVPYEEIAEAAGVGRATLYRHFPTREDLFAAVLDGLLASLEETAASLPPGPARFFALFDACVALQQRNLSLLELIGRSAPPARLLRTRRRFEAMFAEPLAEAQAAGIVSPQTSVVDVRLTLLMLSGVLLPLTPPSERRRAIELARAALVRR